MTSGVVDTDQRRVFVTPGGSNILYGTTWHRDWVGTDQPIVRDPSLVFVNAAGKRIYMRPPKRLRKAEHDYSTHIVAKHDPIVSYRYDQNSPLTFGTTSSLGFEGDYISKWTVNDDLALLAKLRDEVAGSSFNAAVFIAEGQEALQTIFSAARALDGAYRHARRGDFKSAAKSVAKYERSHGRGAQTLANDWLEKQYAVRPLLNDVYDAATLIAKLTGFPMQTTVTVTRKVKGVITSTSPSNVGYLGSGYDAKKIKCILREVNIPQLIGLSDPASVVWEKLPYSFVVDWFVPIGSYLSARGLAQALTGTFVTSRTTKWKAHSPFPRTFVLASQIGYDFDKSYVRKVTLSRVVSDSLSVPVPTIKPLSKVASWEHAANAVALLTGPVGKLSKKL